MKIQFQKRGAKRDVLLSVPWFVSRTHQYLDKQGKLKQMELKEDRIEGFVKSMAKSFIKDLGQFNCHLLLVDDGSPVKVSDRLYTELLEEFPHLDVTVLNLERNVGFGHVVNIIQSIAISSGFRYLIRWDTDVWPQSQFSGVLGGMGENTFLITFKNPATWYLFLLGDERLRSGDHPRFIPVKSMIGNILIYDVKKFYTVGLDDPLLRGYSDVELQYRSDWAGYKTVMDTSNEVKSVPSGANAIGDLFAQEAQLKYLTKISPVLSYSKSNNRLVLRGKRNMGAFHRFVPPSPIAINACMHLGLNINLLPFTSSTKIINKGLFF